MNELTIHGLHGLHGTITQRDDPKKKIDPRKKCHFLHQIGRQSCSYPEFIEQRSIQWEFQDPKMEVLYNISPYFEYISPYIGLI